VLKNLLNLVTLSLLVAVVVLVTTQIKSCTKQENLAQANLELSDSLHHSRNKLGEMVTSTAVIQLENKAFRTQIKTKDSNIIELQKIAKKYKSDLIAATTLTIKTTEKGTDTNVTSIPKDTMKRDNITYIYPEYSDTIRKPWGLLLMVKMSQHKLDYNIEMLNRMTIVTRYQRKHFLAVKEPVIDITTNNPNTGVEELKSYRPTPPKRYTGWKLAGATVLGAIFGIWATH
jgi:hypothetical protein